MEFYLEFGKLWEYMLFCYYFKVFFFECIDMWNEFLNSLEFVCEKEEDIWVCFNYVNYLGVDVMLSLYINGSDLVSLCVIEVYYYQDKLQDKVLVDSIFCGMCEII